ncbi:MAG: hypothetical protein HOY79_19235 [Streptomyces sp.]|nr:hypothetical protein [Streptomyces sp.]NUS29129.1 hypothetical protein [Streptomyces sp.]
MNRYLADAHAQHADALTVWRERRAKAQQITDPEQRAAALEALKGERPVHPFLAGISLAALGRGNRRMLAPLKARHADAKAQHAETLAAWKERRDKARELTDPEQRAKALEELREGRPTNPLLVAAGCTVVATVVVWPMLHGRHAAIIAGGLTLWVLTALILGQDTGTAASKTTTNPDADAEEPGPDDGEWIQEAPAPEVLWALIRHTASLTKQGTAAHLQAVLDEGQKRGQMADWKVADLADELASHGVPVVEQKKLTIGGRQYNRSAVLLADLPEADPAPVPAIVHSAA